MDNVSIKFFLVQKICPTFNPALSSAKLPLFEPEIEHCPPLESPFLPVSRGESVLLPRISHGLFLALFVDERRHVLLSDLPSAFLHLQISRRFVFLVNHIGGPDGGGHT